MQTHQQHPLRVINTRIPITRKEHTLDLPLHRHRNRIITLQCLPPLHILNTIRQQRLPPRTHRPVPHNQHIIPPARTRHHRRMLLPIDPELNSKECKHPDVTCGRAHNDIALTQSNTCRLLPLRQRRAPVRPRRPRLMRAVVHHRRIIILRRTRE